MKVWIDQDLCTGDGLCEEIAPAVFTLLDDGLAYVKEGDKVYSDPGGAEGLANIPDGMLDAVVEPSEDCPDECIFIEAKYLSQKFPSRSFDEAGAGVGRRAARSVRQRGPHFF